MAETPVLTDEDIATTWRRAGASPSDPRLETDPDGTDGDGSDGADGDASDADGTDADGTDAGGSDTDTQDA